MIHTFRYVFASPFDSYRNVDSPLIQFVGYADSK